MSILAGQRIRALDFAATAFDLEVANDTSASTSYVDGTVHGVSFTAPTSGAVWISWGGRLSNNAAATGRLAYLTIYVRDGSTIDAGTDVLAADDDRACTFDKISATAGYNYEQVSCNHYLDGLTAGSSYNVITQFRAVSGTTAVDNRWIRTEPAFA